MGIVEQLWFLGLDVTPMNDFQRDQVFAKIIRFLLTAKHRTTVDLLSDTVGFSTPSNAFVHCNDNFYIPSSNEIALRGKGAFTSLFSILSRFLVGSYCEAYLKFKELCFYYFNLNGDVIMTSTHSRIAPHENSLITFIQCADWDKMAAYFMASSDCIYSYQFVWAVALLLHSKHAGIYTCAKMVSIWNMYCDFYSDHTRVTGAIDAYRRIGILMAILELEFTHVNDVYSYIELDDVFNYCLKLEEKRNVMQLKNFGLQHLNTAYFDMRMQFRNLPIIEFNVDLHYLVSKRTNWHKETLSNTATMYKSSMFFICVIVETGESVTINKNRSLDVEVWTYKSLQHKTNKQETHSFPHDIWLRKLTDTLFVLTQSHKI